MLLGLAACVQQTEEPAIVRASDSQIFEVDPFWPGPLPDNWILGQVAGIDVDSRDHVWVLHRPLSLTPEETGAMQEPPVSECCVSAPPVIEFDSDGDVVRSWGGPDFVDMWPQVEHGIYVDFEDNIWIAGSGAEDQFVLKFSPDGDLLLQIGERSTDGGSNNTRSLGRPTDIAVDPVDGEVYIADGYGNRRIIVFDAVSGDYKRHWGAYGNPPDDSPLPAYDPTVPPAFSFRSPVHAVCLSDDGLVYVADRANNRIQVFEKDGTFVKEEFVAKGTLGNGSVWDIELSRDPGQKYVYVPDGTNFKVWILHRENLEVIGSFGRGGRNAGQFGWVHNVTIDSNGNLYTTEVETGKRVQKFYPVE